MTTAAVAALTAVLALGFVEGMRRFYPARATWARLRSRHGRRAVRAMRERFETAAASRLPRVLAIVLLALVAIWMAAAPVLDKRWYEVALDSLPYAFVSVALLRTRGTLRVIAQRMRDYERDAGEDPDEDLDFGDGTDVIAL
ncbi:MAG: hypothetical protein ACRDJV_09630 [Actinomycetota bacterium]